MSACITDLFADIGWLEFQYRYLSVWVGFLYTEVCYNLLGSGVHFSIKLGDASFLVWVFHGELHVVIYLVCIIKKNADMYFFGYAVDIIYIHFHQVWVWDIRVPVPVPQNIPYRYYYTLDTGEPITAPWSHLYSMYWNEITQLFKKSPIEQWFCH